ncbi:MFS general substrate transporter [Micractinium conductrix]|uniref:MFS general substrate transporter n=1 Tax=Micractinium conductrix TaxID=554055 RepID=A0A2P6VD26_9CHLO|nr:MFS general substrate transporter [Micractinium conductrix]|eukprot:PSC71982.1 MFS general substrate transporter [Micractinium conductrix]
MAYIDYSLLKRHVKACNQAQAAAEQAAGSPPETPRLGSPPVAPAEPASPRAAAAARQRLAAAKAAFQHALDTELSKVLAFYKHRSAELLEAVNHAAASTRKLLAAEQLVPLLPQQGGRGAATHAFAAALETHAAALQAAVQETTQLLQYISLNMTAIRKILKKFAKNVGGATAAPAAGFLALEIEHPDDPGWRVLQGTFLPAAVAAELQGMQQHEALKEAAAQLQSLVALVAERRRALADPGRVSVATLDTQGEQFLDTVQDEVEEMFEAAEAASEHAGLVHAMPWVERAAGMFEPPPPDAFAVATLAGLIINNMSTLLFMSNYTAVLPFTDELCVRVGVPSSYTGLIMASSDIAAILASVGISFWTQVSFKQPLLAAAAACLTGMCRVQGGISLALLLLARLLNGLGSARVANRRYTADYVSKAQRTMASAAFVGASNLGMALGPLLALPLAALPDDGGPLLAGLPLTPVTALGLTMGAAWAAFLLAALLWFRDPPERWEQAVHADKKRERAAVAAWRATVPATVACTLALFVQKAVQQAYLDSLPLFAQLAPALEWRSSRIGLFQGLASLSMVPVNAAVGTASARLSDRSMVLGSLALCAACSAVLAVAGDSVAAFFAAGLLLFVGSVALEGTATSLMSKVIWRGFALGVLNAGLLSTEAGTLGKLTGLRDAGQLAAFSRLLYGCLAGICAALLAHLACVYGRLRG